LTVKTPLEEIGMICRHQRRVLANIEIKFIFDLAANLRLVKEGFRDCTISRGDLRANRATECCGLPTSEPHNKTYETLVPRYSRLLC
jgi:hypothetical protein